MRLLAIILCLLSASISFANPPVAAYIFPAGGQRGTKVNVKVGGLFLHQQCGFEILGKGIVAPKHLTRTKTIWFEGPILPLPDSQRQEDYPRDMAGTLDIKADASIGAHAWRVWTSQGATTSMKFIVGELPEITEDEIDGDPSPVAITLPITINGRIFPREDIDVYSLRAKKGDAIRCSVQAASLGSLLDARLEVRDAQGRRLAESDAPTGGDPAIHFIAPADGEYHVRIDDVRSQGGQAFVYRLTVSTQPFVQHVFPLGGRRGSEVELSLHGLGVPAKDRVSIPSDAPAAFAFSAHNKTTAPIVLDTDVYTEYIAPKIFLKKIPLPAVLNGRVEKPGQIDAWTILAKKGDVYDVEIRAARLGSKLDGVITITDAEGKTLAKAEATTGDPMLRFQPSADGEYRVSVQDRFRSRGGLEFGYRLRIAPPPLLEPDFRLTLATDAVTVLRKGSGKLKLNVERIGGFKEPITLDIQGLPANVAVTPLIVAANQASIDLTFKAEETAKIDVAKLTIVGTAKETKRTATVASIRGTPEHASVLLAVALPTPFVLKGEYDMGFAARGGLHKRKYTIERNGYTGPIEISLADRQARHLQGVEGPTFTVPAGINEFTYSAYLPPWMETGRTCRVCVQGVGVIKEADGVEHRVCFSSVNQNEQLVAVVGPGKLALEVDRTSFVAIPGKSFEIALRVKRGTGVVGSVELELIGVPHMHGVSAAKVTIAAKDERGTLTVTCAERLTGSFNMPMILRATLRQNGEPLVAEVKLDVQP